MTTTTQRGNDFRDNVYGVLAAAGFHVEKEVRINFKKADVSVWVHDTFDGPVRYLVEAKDYSGTLDLEECRKFATEYGALIEGGYADRAWLLSRGSISPDGRKLIEAKKRSGFNCFTFDEFQRHLMRLDGYLRDLLAEYESHEIARFYVRPHTEEHGDLEVYVRRWLDEQDRLPLAVVGGYGKGKSTFALHLAATMAREAIEEPVKRVPILVPLGLIVNEQSVDGLVGKVLASQHRVDNYHFHLFTELNKAGRFLVIFDGFDEMKHGMALQMFEHNMTELMKLDRGNAKLLILGRDTAFHDDREFRAIILGRQMTMSGRELPARDRRPCEPVKLRGFTLEEAHSYVVRYFPLKAREMARGTRRQPDRQWISSRIAELTSERLHELVLRPVHAQMLCEIATQHDISLERVSEFDLYDVFIHYLLDREVKKHGRYNNFTNDVRRRFNAALAWWLWERGGASTTTFADIPFNCVRKPRAALITILTRPASNANLPPVAS